MLHGEGGYSRKAAASEAASYYYSITRLATRGKLFLGNRSLEVTGTSWFDREFSTSHLAPNQVGWDWFSLQLSDGTDLMLYVMRLKDGSLDAASSGHPGGPPGPGPAPDPGRLHHQGHGDLEIPPTPGPPTRQGWQVNLPGAGYSLTVQPTLADQELRTGMNSSITYWEGQVTVQGTGREEPITGQGYVELTGYAGSLGGRF